MKKLILYICLSLLSFGIKAQDIQFTQFYAAPLYLNPAFTGADVCSRAASTYRNQWPAIAKGFVSQSFSFDHFIPKLSSGVGLIITNDKAGTGNLRTLNLGLLYAYELNLTRKLAVRAGFNANYGQRSINVQDLTFGDQLFQKAQGISDPVSRDAGYYAKAQWVDVNAGVLLYSQKYWAGFSAKHLSEPNQSLIGYESSLPRSYSLHAGFKLPVGNNAQAKKKVDKEHLTPAINIRSQRKYSQLDVGCYYYRFPLVLGAWYRGIPLVDGYKAGYPNNADFAVLAGFMINDLKFGYSFDWNMTRMTGAVKGAHEITLSYQFCSVKELKGKKRQKRLIVPCAKF